MGTVVYLADFRARRDAQLNPPQLSKEALIDKVLLNFPDYLRGLVGKSPTEQLAVITQLCAMLICRRVSQLGWEVGSTSSFKFHIREIEGHYFLVARVNKVRHPEAGFEGDEFFGMKGGGLEAFHIPADSEIVNNSKMVPVKTIPMKKAYRI